MKLKPIAAAIAASLFVTTGASYAAETASDSGFYIGAGLGMAYYNYDDVDDSNVITAYGGYRPATSPIGIEVAYVDLGQADISDPLMIFDSFNMKGFNVSALLTSAGSGNPLAVFAKLGFYSLDTELDTVVGSFSESSTGLSWGLGLDFAATKSLVVRGEMLGFVGPEDFASEEDVFAINIGVNYRF